MSFPTYPHEYQNPKASSFSDETVSTWNIFIHPSSNRKIWTVKNFYCYWMA
ncbi:hypothetical protein HanHA300_Chr02g0043991 [Helianthus annuus]|nr:hypothetical protein HanHA300_Chr02g0043991 [Helianthus annuus]KAJ0617941.1 hypothetical protein HanHA89_Chr02g0047491 [Helianthus annuus]